MALWIQNITPDRRGDDELHLYAVRVNNDPPLAFFEHRRADGAAACLRAAADALQPQAQPAATEGVRNWRSEFVQAARALESVLAGRPVRNADEIISLATQAQGGE